jgi:hypothetical protein
MLTFQSGNTQGTHVDYDELHLTGATVFGHIAVDMEKAKRSSAKYNRSRVNGETEDLEGLNDVLRWIRASNPASTPKNRKAFLNEAIKKIEDFDEATYLMTPSLQKLIVELDKDIPVEVFLYILLCPLGCCAGVSRDTVTGAYFKVIEESSNHGMSIHFLILEKRISLYKSRKYASWSCASNWYNGAFASCRIPTRIDLTPVLQLRPLL